MGQFGDEVSYSPLCGLGGRWEIGLGQVEIGFDFVGSLMLTEEQLDFGLGIFCDAQAIGWLKGLVI